MFKLVVLSALVAVALAKPSLYHGEYAVAAPVIVSKIYAAPAAVSSTYREDVVSKPAHITYDATPIVSNAYVAEPIAVAAPVVAKTYVAPAAISHTYREDVISKPATVAYASAVVQKLVSAPVAYAAAPAAYALHAYGANSHGVHAW